MSKDTAPIADDVAFGDRHNMVFSGTAVTYGHGKAIVTATGMRTEMGRIAGLLKETPTSPRRCSGSSTGRQGAWRRRHRHRGRHDRDDRGRGARARPAAIVDVLILGVALAVAAVPEGLPAVVTAVLAIGVQRMARRQAIVRHLAAVETLGSASVIASDKTGTLTRNEMTVRVVVTASGRVTFGGSGYAPEGEVRGEDGVAVEARFVSSSSARSPPPTAPTTPSWKSAMATGPSRATDRGALLVAARKAGRLRATGSPDAARVEVPFSSERSS